MELSTRERLLVALDRPSLEHATALAEQLHGQVGGFKVGLELCTVAGVPAVVQAIAARGGSVFLDLKLKDIPNTVAGAVQAIVSGLGPAVCMLTLHCDGGSAMLRAAVAAAGPRSMARPLLLGVTVLTSIDAQMLSDELAVERELTAQVVHLAQLARASGLDGVVASPWEAPAIRQACGPDFLIVTPGIRPDWAASDDQRRTATPAAAIAAGADFLVVGRPISAAADGPQPAAQRIVQEMADATEHN
jgi:orotidine-5'-phosphate decarboxylase